VTGMDKRWTSGGAATIPAGRDQPPGPGAPVTRTGPVGPDWPFTLAFAGIPPTVVLTGHEPLT